ncbi:PREDICTED: uncharacterized protein At1g27050 [Tarenaya hassleriana]|uniref:uncharacterized protein At1g27050 n=1 Tax=Tarenaya hassleriana TaxID=28532 RepID=UPI00053C832A|nr:PREDICTED: uncharacterized protein At1g27050 [Tarenaya hassleriana]
MSSKRENPSPPRHVPGRISKRRRPWGKGDDEITDKPIAKPPSPPGLVITGLPDHCSVLELKSRFEIYGSISRIRVDRDGSGSVSFRTAESAEAAIAASLEPSGISIDSKRLEVMWATDPLVKWREGVTGGKEKRKTAPSLSSSSKLLRPEMPLRRHGRNNKLASAIVDPKSITNDVVSASASVSGTEFTRREVVAYDDIL